eukprot:SAG11_NODE_1348_length_5137_cov_3.785232_3_plen_39_part_00
MEPRDITEWGVFPPVADEKPKLDLNGICTLQRGRADGS